MSKRPIDDAVVESSAKKPTPAPLEPHTELQAHQGLSGFLNLIRSGPQPSQKVGVTTSGPGRPLEEDKSSITVNTVPPKQEYKLKKILNGHTGWVNTVAVEPDNRWMATGSSDCTIKIWDLASGRGKLTLTGHKMAIQALAISDRMPYMFSAGLDRTTKCWDLEQNQVIREFHGHRTGVTGLELHPSLNIVVTGCRDGSAHVWDIRSREQVFNLKGHKQLITSIKCCGSDPQVITASGDASVRFWDLRTGYAVHALTAHQHAVGAIEIAPNNTIVTASKDSLRKWSLPRGELLEYRENDSYVHSMSLSPNQVLAITKADGGIELINYTGSLTPYQTISPPIMPGSLDAETPILACTFDKSGSRLITGHSDKTTRMLYEL